MTQLEADLCLAVFMDEIGDPPPCGDMFVAPHAGTSRRDPPSRRNTGHFRKQQARTALRTGAKMDEVEVVGRAVLCRIHRHWRDYDSVLDLHPAQFEGREHRPGGLGLAGGLAPEGPLRILQPVAI